MNNTELLKTVTERAQKWLGDQYDEETRAEVRAMLDAEDKTQLIEAFYKDLVMELTKIKPKKQFKN